MATVTAKKGKGKGKGKTAKRTPIDLAESWTAYLRRVLTTLADEIDEVNNADPNDEVRALLSTSFLREVAGYLRDAESAAVNLVNTADVLDTRILPPLSNP